MMNRAILKKLTVLWLLTFLVANVSFAAETRWHKDRYYAELDKAEYTAVNKYLDSIEGLVNEMLKTVDEAENNPALINQLITYSTSGLVNHWQVTSALSRKADGYYSALGDKGRKALNKILITTGERTPSLRVDLLNHTDSLFNSSLEYDAKNPTDEERAKAMVTLNELCDQIKKDIVQLRKCYYLENGGALLLVSDEEQIDVYTELLRFKKQLEMAKPDIAKDKAKVDIGRFPVSVVYYEDGTNYWGMKESHKTVFAALEEEFKSFPDVLNYTCGGDSPFYQVASKLGGTLDKDWWGKEQDDAYDAVYTAKDLIDDGLDAFKDLDTVFRQIVPNAADKIKAAENRLNNVDDGSSTTTPSSDDNQQNQQQPVPDSIVIGGVPAGAQQSAGQTSTNSSDQAGSASSQQQTSNVAVPASSYNIQRGDTLGAITVEQLYDKFIQAGWKPEDIPPLWGGNGLIEVLANYNNMSDINQPISADTELRIPPVPRPPANGQNPQEAFRAWSHNPDAVSPPVSDQGNSNPSQNQSATMTRERLLTEGGSFMEKYFPYTNSINALAGHLNARPRDGKFYGTNRELLLWSIGVVKRSIKKIANANGGKVDRQTYAVAQTAVQLESALKKADGKVSSAQMKVLLGRYNAYRKALGLRG